MKLQQSESSAAAIMEFLSLDDDICILKHETADGLLEPLKESPVSRSSGDESIASHFALVTAYEDIKKRLQVAEKENTALKRRIWQLEHQVILSDQAVSEGPAYVNKAFLAFQGIYVEKADLEVELEKVKMEKLALEQSLTEQLQVKEVELLQLRSEVDTHQVMTKLSVAPDPEVSSEVKVHALEQQLDILRAECSRLRQKAEVIHGSDEKPEGTVEDAGMASLLQAYRDLRSEMAHLYAVTEQQSAVVRKLRGEGHGADGSRAYSFPVQCLDDVEGDGRRLPTAALRPLGSSFEPLAQSAWAHRRLSPVGSPSAQEHQPYARDALEERPPRPSDVRFWEDTRGLAPRCDHATYPQDPF
ncbi:5-azacytidine-induced protein 2 [Erpetoichthys calabaricus]|uniref:5-azacytidine-induced protein 2 n=1 Tax=Erpetoichthys calabaricus TaxID=27687 RepID=A0A8C4SMJ8_ERPCA|nr:5-azacytidine-induced protein 2 [Erpetoichthys calabaricus]